MLRALNVDALNALKGLALFPTGKIDPEYARVVYEDGTGQDFKLDGSQRLNPRYKIRYAIVHRSVFEQICEQQIVDGAAAKV
jgi:hypothetical protein